MHAYLIIGNSEERTAYSKKLAARLKAKILEFPLAKIEDARRLKSFVSLKITHPTAIYIESIDLATEEALNAFLKSLEEPQENLYYIMTAQSLGTVLPTITSRCQVIKVQSTKYKVQSTDSEKFLKLTIGEKLKEIDKIKDRQEAKEFVQSLIELLHFNLLNLPENKMQVAKDLEIAVKTLNNLESNGNINLQLTNLIINQV